MLTNKFTSTTSRNDGIDFLRGFSIISVILLHCYIHMPLPENLLSPKLINIIFRSGYYGVVIFFVISGFLITATSLRKWGDLNKIDYIKFYQMRFARIIPCLLVLLLILSILDVLRVPGFVIQSTSLIHAVFSALTFQINLLEAKTGYLPGSWDILWSLSVEEMFYLFFPLLCLLFKNKAHFIGIMIVFIILGPFARTVFTDNDLWSDHSYLSCMDGIAIGCVAALWVHDIRLNKKILYSVFYSGLCLFVFIFIFRTQAYQLGISKIGLNVTILEISIGMILITMHEWYAKEKSRGSLWLAPIRWFGRNSYENYLIHSLFVITIAKTLYNYSQTPLLIISWYLIVLIISGIFAQWVSSYFSEPMNKLIREVKLISFNKNSSKRSGHI